MLFFFFFFQVSASKELGAEFVVEITFEIAGAIDLDTSRQNGHSTGEPCQQTTFEFTRILHPKKKTMRRQKAKLL